MILSCPPVDIQKIIRENSLELNEEKKKVVECYGDKKASKTPFKDFDFLGYNLRCRPYLKKKKLEWRDVSVHIADSKLKKLKSRIAHAFIDHAATPDFALLQQRLKFLTGNYTLRGDAHGGLRGGIHYNYRHISCPDDSGPDNLIDLDRFLRRMIFCKNGSLGKRLAVVLTGRQRRHLARLSFVYSFKQRLSHGLPKTSMTNIRRCWIYEKN